MAETLATEKDDKGRRNPKLPSKKTKPTQKDDSKYKTKISSQALLPQQDLKRMWSRVGFELPTTCFPTSSLNH
jgi:hypothetical protein